MIDYLDPDFTDFPGRRTALYSYKLDRVACKHIDVSIVTPYYNTGELFLETFASVQAQSLQNWEWLIVDDGSTDHESVLRLHELTKRDERIRVINQINSGTATARNTGFSNSCGRYICLLDHDDMIEPTYLEKCVWFLDSYQEFAFCNSYSVVFGDQNFLWTTGYERGKAFLQANSGPPISVIRRSAYVKCGGFDESIRVLYEDWDFWLAMAKTGHWGYTIPEFLQWYRKLGSGRYEKILESGYDNNEFAKIMQQKYYGLDKHFPELYRRQSQPYEDIETISLVTNPLAPNQIGRRIMFIVPWMVMGGADRVNLDLIEGLTSRGHDVTVCATLSAEHQWENQFGRFTPDIFVLPNFLHASDFPRFLAYLIESRQIDTVVISGSTIGYQLIPFLRSVFPHTAFVDICHVEEPHWLNGGHPRFGVGYQDVLDLNIVTTKHLSEWMQRRGANALRIKVMYTGVRSLQAPKLVEVRDRIRADLGIPTDLPVIVFAGRICIQKRPLVLAEILRAVHKHGLAFRALIIGDGEQRELLEELLTEYNLTATVQTLGSVSHQTWLEILVSSDIFLMPSQYEGISIALLEALAAGVVPVVAKVGGHEEIVDNNIGVLIPQGDNELQEYLDAICHLLSDSEELRRMAARCKEFAASNLAWNVMIDKFLTFLDVAHHFRDLHPRNAISLNLGKELASLSLEYKRLNDEVNKLMNSSTNSDTVDVKKLQLLLGDKEKYLSEILCSKRWRLINVLSKPYRKLKHKFLKN